MATALVLLAAGALLFVVIEGQLLDEVTEKLTDNIDRVVSRLDHGEPVSSLPPLIEVERATGSVEVGPKARSVELFDPLEQDTEFFREVVAVRSAHGDLWHITVRQVILEPHDLFGPIGISLISTMLVLLVTLWLIDRRISKVTWAPFRWNLDRLKGFDPHTDDALRLRSGGIAEFAEMNAVVEDLAQRVRSDFTTMKAFTANAAHEMRTPVAAVLNSLELALQSPQLNEGMAAAIGRAHEAAQRLSKLHQALLSLARVENIHVANRVPMDVVNVVRSQIDQLKEAIDAKRIVVRIDGTQRCDPVGADPMLMEQLIANLLGNAVKHNVDGGGLSITTESRALVIGNSGPPTDLPAERFFDRFVKADPSSRSLGLGLAIAKSICQANGWRITYRIVGSQHTVRIEF